MTDCPNGCDGPVAALHRDDDDQPTVAQCVNCGAEWPVEEPEAEPEEVKVGEPLVPMTPEDIIKYARGVMTQEYMLADIRDRDWQQSLMLLMAHLNPIPPNASTLFLVPMGPHMGGRWLNGRVPGVTLSATMVPMEDVDTLIAQCDTFYKALHPEVSADDGPG